MQQLYLGFSTRDSKNLSNDVAFAKKHGFNAISIETSYRPNLNFTRSEIQSLKKFSKKNQILIHMPFFMPTNSSILELGEGIFKYFERSLFFAKKIGAHTLTFHTGYVESGEKPIQGSLIPNLKKITLLAKKLNVHLSIENDSKGHYLLWNPIDIKTVLKNLKNVKLTYDIGHANTAGIDPAKFFKMFRKNINVIHLHNNFGKDTHNQLDEGNLNYEEILPLFRNSKNIIYILELPKNQLNKGKNLFYKYLINNKSR